MRTATLTLIMLFLALSGYHTASAQTSTSTPLQSAITQALHYPIPELGYCMSKTDCKAYCDLVAHIQPCLLFAQSHGLMTEIEAQKALLLATFSGPQGCRGQQCLMYCSDAAHSQECTTFVNRLLKLSDITKPLEPISTSTTLRPGAGGCKNPTECAAYCRAHEAECRAIGARMASSTSGGSIPMPPPMPVRPKMPPRGSDTSSSIVSYLGAAAFSALMLFLHI